MDLRTCEVNLSFCKFLITAIILQASGLEGNNVTLVVVNGTFIEIEGQVYYSTEVGASISFECKAVFPIRWNIVGFIHPVESVNFCAPKRSLSLLETRQLSIFEIGVTITFKDGDGFPAAGLSARISCENIENPKVNREIVFIFARKETQNPFTDTIDMTVANSTLLPCPTKDPTPEASPKLFENGVLVERPGVSYRPTEGFVLTQEFFNGTYICNLGSYNKTIFATVTGPTQNNVSAFSDEAIKLECFSPSKQPINITVTPNNGSIDLIERSTDDGVSVEIRLKDPASSAVSGDASCIEFSEAKELNALVLKAWHFEFITPPQLIIDHDLEVLSCFSKYTPTLVQTVVCNDPIECNFLTRCFENTTYCNCKQYNKNNVEACPSEQIEEQSCINVPYELISQTGLLQCVVRNLTRKWEYFKSIDSERLYTSSDEAPPNDLIRIYPKQNVEKRNTDYFCVAVAYVFVDSLSFRIELKNGTMIDLINNNKTVNISETSIFGRIHRSKKLHMKMPSSAKNLYCRGNYWNSTQTIEVMLGLSDDKDEANIVVYIALGVVVFLYVYAIFIFVLDRYKGMYNEAQELLRNLTDREMQEFFDGQPEFLTTATKHQMDAVEYGPYNKNFEIPLEDLRIDTTPDGELGSGEFSNVKRGKLISESSLVAIKMSKSSTDVRQFKILLSEVKMMIYIGQHDHVVALVGVCTEDIKNRYIYIVTEICELGKLDVFLQKARSLFLNLVNGKQELDKSLLMFATGENSSPYEITTLDLIKFAGQIAKGMEYLSSKSVVHSELAARNMLLTKNKVVKISDFGLSRRLYKDKNYVRTSETPIPWRWMAVESLKNLTFSTASDVWAYGVTLFEIFTLGETPFPNIEFSDSFVDGICLGKRMKSPKYSTQEIYEKMLGCWENEPSRRPSFETLRVFFEDVANEYMNNTFVSNPCTVAGVVAPGTSEPKPEGQ